MPEAGAESWDRVKVVEAVFEVLAALVEGRVSHVDGAFSVEVGGAKIVNFALGTDANIVGDVLRVARVLVRIV